MNTADPNAATTVNSGSPAAQGTAGCVHMPPADASPASDSSETTPGRNPPALDDVIETLNEFFGRQELVYIQGDAAEIPSLLRFTNERSIAFNGRLPAKVVGVVCGRAPDPLFAIAFADREEVKAFKVANPALASTPITYWPQAPGLSTWVIWLRCNDGVPLNVDTDLISWVGSGVVPVAIPSWAADRFLRRPGPIPTLQFSEIKWPAMLERRFQVLKLEDWVGPRFNFFNGRIVLNTTFGAHFIAKNAGLVFLVGENRFCLEQDGKLVPIPDPPVLNSIMEHLRKESVVEPQFPISDINPALAKRVLEEMRLAAAMQLPTRDDALDEFLEQRLQTRRGHNVTVLEIYADYRCFCKSGNRPFYMPGAFQRLITDRVEKKFGVLKSHDLKRARPDGVLRAQRGFHALRIVEEPPTLADASDDADGPDVSDATKQNLEMDVIHGPS